MKFGLLAEIRRGRGLRGVHEPNLLSGIFLLFKNDLIAPKHEKSVKKYSIKLFHVLKGVDLNKTTRLGLQCQTPFFPECQNPSGG